MDKSVLNRKTEILIKHHIALMKKHFTLIVTLIALAVMTYGKAPVPTPLSIGDAYGGAQENRVNAN
jgi:hypothetical protein